MKLHFLGANRQVTGSRYVLEAGGLRVMIDCGLFQERDFLSRNWDPCPIPADSIDILLLTHAHLDHSGLIPRLVREGYERPILTTAPSRELAEIILEDAAHIQEEDAAYKRKRHAREGRTPPRPVAPLYTAADVRSTLPLFQTVDYDRPVELNRSVQVTYRDAGHILGSALLEIEVKQGAASRTLVFSGDVGQTGKPIISDPYRVPRADFLVMESTYGNRLHDKGGPIETQLEGIVNDTVARGGNVIIPTFAVERAQELVYYLRRLLEADRIPNLLVFLDSPMAVDVTDVFRRHAAFMDAEMRTRVETGYELCSFPSLRLVRSVAESKAINRIRGSCIIMAGSGMCTAGRIKHHLASNIGRAENTVLFTGYQSEGTLGREILEGAQTVRIHGEQRRVRAKVAKLNGLSAHADQQGLLHWLGALKAPPRRVFLTHGESSAAESLAGQIRSHLRSEVMVPEYRQVVELT